MRLIRLVALGALAAVSSSLPGLAQTAPGELRCTIQGGVGAIIAANRAVTCAYRRPAQPVEFYTGYTNTIGLDIGPTNARAVTYRVTTADPAVPGALQGDFAGPGFGIAGGAGLSAEALVGAGGLTLVPVPDASTTSTTGFNIAGGLHQLHLQFAAVEQTFEPHHKRRHPPIERLR